MRVSFIICTVLLLTGSVVSAQDRAVNVRTSGAQCNPAVTAGPDGFVVVWTSYYSSSGRSNEIMARRFDPNGEPLTDGEFQVNSTRLGNQTEPAVAMGWTGDFIVAWQGPGVDQEDVFFRLYDNHGQALGDELPTDPDSVGRQLRPRLALGRDGTFVMAWEERISDGSEESCAIRAQRFDGSGFAPGQSLLVDEGLGDGRYPEVAMDERGRFAVVWLLDRTGRKVMARLFDPNDQPRTEPFEISTWAFSSLTNPAIAMNASGQFVVVWDGDPNLASQDDVYGRCFDPNGVPRSNVFRVNSLRDGAQQWSQVAMADTGEFVVVWQHETADPNEATDVLAQRFDARGSAVGDRLRLNTYTTGKQRYPDVAMMPDGGFVAVWESDGQDGSGYSIQACIQPPAP
jgi:hypothetical protein